MRQENSSDLAHPESCDATLQNGLEIARSQLRRHRRGLGSLTEEQEKAIEALLVRTVNRVSKAVGQMLESWPAVP
jgi:hypothetical protein